jgi:hypothetical protein
MKTGAKLASQGAQGVLQTLELRADEIALVLQPRVA